MNQGYAPSPITQQVDGLMRGLYRRSRGQLHQTLLADFSIADAYRNHLDPSYPASSRPIVRATRASWRILRKLVGAQNAARVGGVLWMMIGIPELVVHCLRLHRDAYIRQGDADARHVLLRTGVSNEPLIARWIAQRENAPVVMLQYNDSAKRKLYSLRHFPGLLKAHMSLCLGTIKDISRLIQDSHLRAQELDALGPAWFVLLARCAMNISWNHCWAKACLADEEVKSLYFTMNYANENAFRLALSAVPAAYVEHGFPRRDIPPLPCKQYVYSDGYAAYMKSFEPSLDVETIGLGYFDKGEIEPTKTIVVASLQDWPQYKIERVKDIFNAALNEARRNGWKLVFRTRRYDTDAFANALNGPWDEISKAGEESFQQCLTRTNPAMVWTTWSTAVLDARAQSIIPVAFVTPDLDDYFISDLEAFAFVVATDETFQQLHNSLRQASANAAMKQLDSNIGGPRCTSLARACN